MEEAKGQSILDKMLTTFINTLVKAAENEAQTHFGKNLERSEESRVRKECRSRWSPYH